MRVCWTQTQSSRPSQIILNKKIESWKTGQGVCFWKISLVSRPMDNLHNGLSSSLKMRRCTRASSLSTLKTKPCLKICQRYFWKGPHAAFWQRKKTQMTLNKREMKRGAGVTRTKGIQRDSSVWGHQMALEPALTKAEWKQASSALAMETHLVNRAGESMRASLLLCSTAITMAMEMVECVTWSLSTHDLSLVSHLPIHTQCKDTATQLCDLLFRLPLPQQQHQHQPLVTNSTVLAKHPVSPHTYLGTSHHHVEQAGPRTERHSEQIRFEIGLIAPFHHLFSLG